jgi:hypothetical protein
MGEEWQQAWDRLQSLCRITEEAEARYHAMCPDFPATLTKTDEDWKLGLCARPYEAASVAFDMDLVEQFRRKPRVKGG